MVTQMKTGLRSLCYVSCLKFSGLVAQIMQKFGVSGIVKLYENSFQNLLLASAETLILSREDSAIDILK